MQNAVRKYELPEKTKIRSNILEIYRKPETLTEQFARLFQAQNGVQCIMLKGSSGNVEQYFTKDLAHEIERQKGQRDVYFTANSFYKQKRHVTKLREINALYVDLDLKSCEMEGFDAHSLLNASIDIQVGFLEQICRDSEIPLFTAVVKSGNGYHLYWKIEAIPVWSIRVRKSWQQTENEIVSRLMEFGADTGARAINQLLRLPQTKNGKLKRNNVVDVLFVDEMRQYENRELRRDFFPDSQPYDPNKYPKWNKKSTPKSRAGRIHHLFNEHNLYTTRMEDLQKLIEIREGHMPKRKQSLLFILACLHTTGNMEDDLYELLNDTNMKFDDPVEERELLYLVKQATSGRLKYRFRNVTIIDYLAINEEEEQELKTIISKDEKRRREAIRKRQNYAPTKKRNQQAKKERDERITVLRAEGKTHKEIADTIEISVSTVTRVLRKDK